MTFWVITLIPFGKPYGFEISYDHIPSAMAIPVFGYVCGFIGGVSLLATANHVNMKIFMWNQEQQSISAELGVAEQVKPANCQIYHLDGRSLQLLLHLAVQLYSDSMILAGLVGVAILSCAGIFKWKEADDVIITGMRMMALVGFIMIAAQGFAAVIEATNQVPALVEASVQLDW